MNNYDNMHAFFKFQSDSINTDDEAYEVPIFQRFKFQSDSINTDMEVSNRMDIVDFKFQSDSINTHQFKTIRCFFENFKFQSDSINTSMHIRAMSSSLALNSNLILLIRFYPFQQVRIYYSLNSNLILLIHKSVGRRKGS